MTSAEAPKRLYIPQPFASAEGAALTEIEAATSNNVNFADGFPSVYEAPSSNNGKFVTRGILHQPMSLLVPAEGLSHSTRGSQPRSEAILVVRFSECCLASTTQG